MYDWLIWRLRNVDDKWGRGAAGACNITKTLK